MEKKSSFINKDFWNQVFPYLDLCDYFALELCNRNFKNILNNYYVMKTRNISNTSFNKNQKKIFFSIFKDYLVIYNVKGEFNSLEETEQFKTSSVEGNENKKLRKLSNQIIESNQTTKKIQENSLFCQG